MGGVSTKTCWGCSNDTSTDDHQEQLHVEGSKAFGDELDLSPTFAHLIVKFQLESGTIRDMTMAQPVGLRLTKDGKESPVVVKSVTPKGFADKVGVKPGWKVLEVAAKQVSQYSEEELYRAIHGKLENNKLSLQSVLDVMDDFRPQIPVVSCFFEQHSSKEAKANALAKVAAASMNKPDEADKLVPIVLANLELVAPLSGNAELAIKRYLALIGDWKFETTGNPDNPPKLSDSADQEISITQKEMVQLHILAYIHFPERFHTLTTMLGLTGSLIRGLPSMTKPFAVITVGPPGSGKTFCLQSTEGCLGHIQKSYNGPSSASYVEIDPDFWISSLCDNDNAYRPLCNLVNLENFFYAIKRRHNIIFGGTGKDMRNTCGRVTARLKQAEYKIFYAIILCSFDVCMQRIDNRFKETGRAVPTPVVRSIFEGLQKSVVYYLENQADLADGILIYDNSQPTGKLEPIVLKRGDDPKSAVQRVNELLKLPS